MRHDYLKNLLCLDKLTLIDFAQSSSNPSYWPCMIESTCHHNHGWWNVKIGMTLYLAAWELTSCSVKNAQDGKLGCRSIMGSNITDDLPGWCPVFTIYIVPDQVGLDSLGMISRLHQDWTLGLVVYRVDVVEKWMVWNIQCYMPNNRNLCRRSRDIRVRLAFHWNFYFLMAVSPSPGWSPLHQLCKYCGQSCQPHTGSVAWCVVVVVFLV